MPSRVRRGCGHFDIENLVAFPTPGGKPVLSGVNLAILDCGICARSCSGEIAVAVGALVRPFQHERAGELLR